MTWRPEDAQRQSTRRHGQRGRPRDGMSMGSAIERIAPVPTVADVTDVFMTQHVTPNLPWQLQLEMQQYGILSDRELEQTRRLMLRGMDPCEDAEWFQGVLGQLQNATGEEISGDVPGPGA